MNISNAIEEFLSTKKFEGFSPFTIKGYRQQYKILIRDIGDIDIELITLHMLRDHVAKEGEHLKASSLTHKVRAIKSLFHWLADEEYLIKNPASKLHEPKLPQRIPKALTIEEIELLRDSCKTSFEHALIEFFFATGCRVGEVAKLDKESINWNKNSVMAIGKGDKQRECYFGARCAIWLKRYLESRKDNDPALFVTKNAPHRMPVHRIQDIFKMIAKRCGLEKKVHPHTLRHSLATLMLDNGAPLHMIQSLLGHDKPSTTLLYTRLSGTARKQAYDRYFTQ